MLWDLKGNHSKQGYFHPTLFLCQLPTCYKKVQRTTIWTLVMGTFISSQPPHNHQFNNIMIDPLHHPYLPCYVVFALWDTAKNWTIVLHNIEYSSASLLFVQRDKRTLLNVPSTKPSYTFHPRSNMVAMGVGV